MKDAALLEAILYLEADPVDEGALVRISGLSRERVTPALEALEERYGREESALELSRIGGGIIISPKKEYWENLKDRYGRKNESRLSRAAMETLSIIAYSQPITRIEIEHIRGVLHDAMIPLLVEKGLIRELGKKDVPGKPTLYGTTREFLRAFHLNSIADLPKLNDSESDRFEKEAEE
ncbi:MAG: SMC-Scp complex subunit ScpB [Treponema sp.]|nr:SMC-Scp complex subunit ScpB [Treponema sp.]